ncbi:actin, putative [Trypanosoma equiperdum]|uniref:Actin, putative n=3 Tax=Trypanozoon TaxID=39700 RepID=Q580C6_TRYB2|nr:actin, putative [Trypanosoma brucei brucei TREU927]AAX80912.1 actin, putative [Trypanosoma brucei]AAZ10689.1 actin, putative [Trypanosoma brucei brucei TREU927]ABF58711.1 actin-like protein 4 [Trypanosoma brucei]SCU71093.1 actin, putative [Trypanosoma equiperdum]
MAVVEIGWNVRAGYVGDTRCARQFPSLHLLEPPAETSFPSVLMAADGAGSESVSSMWTLQSLDAQRDSNMDYLSRIIGDELHCLKEETLTLVVPEVWHERFDVMRALFHSVLESGVATALYCLRPSVAWALSSGKCSTVVLDVGHSHATAAAVLDGYALRGTVASSDVAGKVVTEVLKGMLDSEQLQALEGVARFKTPTVRALAMDDLVGDIKRLACTVRTDASESNKEEGSLVLRAPDGSAITVEGRARVEAYEVLFRSVGGFGSSLGDLVVGCKQRLDPEWQLQFVSHTLCGGTAQAPGFRERLLTEVQQRDSCYFRYEKEGGFHLSRAVDGAWVGASLATDSSSFASLWITRADMEEEGDSVLYRKLFY